MKRQLEGKYMEVMYLEGDKKKPWRSSISERQGFPNSNKKCKIILDWVWFQSLMLLGYGSWSVGEEKLSAVLMFSEYQTTLEMQNLAINKYLSTVLKLKDIWLVLEIICL